VEQLKKVQSMRGREGETFKGTVSGEVNGGLFVTLPNTIEGFIPKEEIRRRGKVRQPKLGDTVTVRLTQVDEEGNKLYFTTVRNK
jgi:ribosomal protein S1